ncbi:zinc-ribbon and DUF3426 domain-containing protein [Paraburkholderia fynbosensis]|uniref:Zinc finger/thioredoxin putative domain-containing protein n=1 Tax=Paraburkholderia fynbosensis TaxID=1200993 RepID=A0A6J5FFM9_9BURK|nr:zinc-ribbon and DUF3426 domain-containing protein [Paraburkholderia fynbosensis]CAB3779300.1 hypothetical protein LMG27177_00656 [Paraburkholderia fynbosensis]
MLLATRCPFCETVFRLQPAQLAQRRGLVRCGHCHEVFDASSSLFDVTGGGDFSTAKPVAAAAAIEALSGVRHPDPDFSAEAWDPGAPVPDASIDNRLLHKAGNVPLAPVSTDAGAPRTPDQPVEPELPADVFSKPLPPDDEPVLADAPLDPYAYRANDEPPVEEAPRVWHKTGRASEPALGETASLHGIADNEPHFGTSGLGAAADLGAAGFGAAAGAGGSGTGGPGGPGIGGAAPAASGGEPFSVNPVNDGSDPFPVVRETRPADARRVGQAIAASIVGLVLVFLLLAQLAWWQRETVQVYLPRTQTLYVKACSYLGCQLTPPHDIDGLQVEPSDLRQIDGPHKLELKMPLHNRYGIALAYPAIELTLLDDQNNVAVRRVLWPQDYVAPGTAIAAGLPAHTTQTMIVHLDTGTAVASNFRVQIFYP